MPFYTFGQNNSGGYFIKNEYVDEYVIIEAENAQAAIEKADRIFENYSDYCPCCGERWNTDFMDESEATPEPAIYGQPVIEFKSIWNKDCYIVYLLDQKRIDA